MEHSGLRLVLMEEVAVCRWRIVTVKGHVLKEDITVSGLTEAEEYIRNYVSSFRNWDYAVVPMEE